MGVGYTRGMHVVKIHSLCMRKPNLLDALVWHTGISAVHIDTSFRPYHGDHLDEQICRIRKCDWNLES